MHDTKILEMPAKAADGYVPESHFLSIIAFDGMITQHTAEALLLAQGEELRRTKGGAGLWQGWKFHAGEGQVRSRNECADQFLRTPCTHHLFLDSDLLPMADHIKRLRRHPEAKDSIICGCYAKKQQKVEHCYNSLPGGNPAPNARMLFEISKGGTGFMQIPRVAYEKVMAKFPERFYRCDYEFVPVTPQNPHGRARKFSFFFHDIRQDSEMDMMRDMSEDWAFCWMARQAGVKIYLDGWTSGETGEVPPVWHRGHAFYPLVPELQRQELEHNFIDLGKKMEELDAENKRLRGQIASALTPAVP